MPTPPSYRPFDVLLPCRLLLVAAAAALVSRCQAQFVNPRFGANLTTVSSPADPDVKISYKDPGPDACRTVFASQQQYTGWVSILGEYPTNLFFWFVAAREETDLLTIWLNGGPGSSSIWGFFNGNGPCEVVEKGLDEYETVARDWGWDRVSNMLYIDQPNQVGFSFDIPTNGTLDLLSETKFIPPEPKPRQQQEGTMLNGTFSSLDVDSTANTTEIAAVAVWHLIQGFLGTFPEYNPPDNSSMGVNLFAESYGGKYGPVFADVWEDQNAKIATGELPDAIDIHLVSLGIVNGCIDMLIEGPYYPVMSSANSYGLQAITPLAAQLANDSFYAPGGCQELILQCHAGIAALDPENDGDVVAVNEMCTLADRVCQRHVVNDYYYTGRSPYDISVVRPDTFPPSTYLEYLNSAGLQEAIGAVTNFSMHSSAVWVAFDETGDFIRGPVAPRIAELLNSGIRVGLMYGDRDYICNWYGGEAVSLEIARTAGGPYAQGFPNAGYAPIVVNDTYVGGAVRQFGNLSFSRIYQAGHAIPSYQPETAFQVFARIALGTSISTGDAEDLDLFATEGTPTAEEEDRLPDAPEPTCWLRDIDNTCDAKRRSMIFHGEGVTINGVVYASSEEWPLMTRTTASTTASSTSQVLTGVFTATSVPDAASLPDPRGSLKIMGLFMGVGVFWLV